tara:strand:+ start:1560 stop:1727 length:168 start_codon:yes stop_codon:yes gene_type:complete
MEEKVELKILFFKFSLLKINREKNMINKSAKGYILFFKYFIFLRMNKKGRNNKDK